jgi:hypothetical protein
LAGGQKQENGGIQQCPARRKAQTFQRHQGSAAGQKQACGGAVAIYGQRLELGCMSADGAAVCGRIQRIEFEEREGV